MNRTCSKEPTVSESLTQQLLLLIRFISWTNHSVRLASKTFRSGLWIMWKDPIKKKDSFTSLICRAPVSEPMRAGYWTQRAAPFELLGSVEIIFHLVIPTLKVTTCCFRREVTSPTKKRVTFYLKLHFDSRNS